MNRLGGLSRALLVRKTTSAQVKSMSTDIVKTDITKTVVKMRTAGKTDAGRVDMYPADLWLYEAMYGLPEIFVYLNTASHCRGTSSARTSCCSPNQKPH